MSLSLDDNEREFLHSLLQSHIQYYRALSRFLSVSAKTREKLEMLERLSSKLGKRQEPLGVNSH